MKNVTMKVTGSILSIEVDLSKEGTKSASGKSLVIASTQGNQPVPGFEAVMVGLNCYTAVK